MGVMLVRDFAGRIVDKIETRRLYHTLSSRIRRQDIIDARKLQEEKKFYVSCHIRLYPERITVDFWLVVKKQDDMYLISMEPVSKEYIRTLAFAVATYITQKLEKQNNVRKLKSSRRKDTDTFPIYLQKTNTVGKYLVYDSKYAISLYKLMRIILRYFKRNPLHVKHNGTRLFTLEAA